MLIENIVIYDFERAWFNEDYSALSKENFEIAYSEYVDVSGLYATKQFEALSYINYISNRISSISISIAIQRDFTNTMGHPFEEGLGFFKRFGHVVLWKNDKKQFLDYLVKIESKEQRYVSELKKKQLQFTEESQKKKSEAKGLMQSRHEWITMINSLKKRGYDINRKETFVEELALIIKEVKDESKPPFSRV